MIYKIIDSILEPFDYPFYCGMPIFGEREPPLYVVYSVWEQPDLYGDGKILTDKYTMSLHFFCDVTHYAECRLLEKRIKKQLLENDWHYLGSQTPSVGIDEPQQRHIVYDYCIDLESEE